MGPLDLNLTNQKEEGELHAQNVCKANWMNLVLPVVEFLEDGAKRKWKPLSMLAVYRDKGWDGTSEKHLQHNFGGMPFSCAGGMLLCGLCLPM